MKQEHNLKIVLATFGLSLLAGCGNGQPPASIGLMPAPWAVHQIGEATIRAKLKDPESARFKWPYATGRTKWGYLACGLVNAKNSFGGYTGFTMFSIYFVNEQPTTVWIDDSRGGLAQIRCESALKKGVIRQVD